MKVSVRNQLALCLQSLDKFDESEAALEEAYALSQKHYSPGERDVVHCGRTLSLLKALATKRNAHSELAKWSKAAVELAKEGDAQSGRRRKSRTAFIECIEAVRVCI
jgi:tetratricopeptide (TPR) repeat protein